MDRTEIVAEIRNRLGEETPDFWSQTQIYRAIQAAQVAFCQLERWPWLLTEGTGTLALGAELLALPADVDLTRSFALGLKVGTEHKHPAPRRVTPMEGFHLRREHTSAGLPRYFYVVKGVMSAPGAGDENMTYTLRFVPIADVAYFVEYVYFRNPAPLTADNHEPDLPEKYHEAVIAWATASLWLPELQGGDIKSQEQLALYQEVVTMAQRDLRRFTEDEEVVWGREQNEEDRRLMPYPATFGPMTDWFSW